MAILVPTSTGKLRVTSGGKLRAGCCPCGEPCEHCGEASTPEYLSLEFSGITVAGCVYQTSTLPFQFCHYNEFDDDINVTVVAQRCPGCTGEDFVPCCWIGDTGVEARHLCDSDPGPHDPPAWFPVKVVVYPYAFVAGQWIFGVYLGYLSYTYGQCVPPVSPTSDVVAFFSQIAIESANFCAGEVNVNNEVVLTETCKLGANHLAYGGSVAITPL